MFTGESDQSSWMMVGYVRVCICVPVDGGGFAVGVERRSLTDKSEGNSLLGYDYI